MSPIIIFALVGLLAVFTYLVYFALVSRRDPLTPFAAGRGARWARRSAGVSVTRVW
jgi:hypothetical protein